MSIQSFINRRKWARNDAKRDAGLTPPSDVVARCNIVYGDDDKWQVLDIYRPKGVKKKLPVIVNFHGGGWIYGDKDVYRFYCMELAREGFAVVNPSYRLAPEYRFPAAFEDMRDVFSFVLNHPEKGGFDTDNIFGIGDSAGATGMAVIACLLTNPDYAAKFPVEMPEGLELRGVALNCGMFSMNGKRDALKDFLPQDLETDTLRLLHVPKYITPDFPPAFLLTGVADFNCEETRKMAKVLKKYGVDTECVVYGDEDRPLGHVFQCDIQNEDAISANLDEMDFFKSLL